MLSSRSSGVQSAVANKEAPPRVPQERPHAINGSSHNQIMANNNGSAPTAKVQVDEVDICTIFWEERVDHCFKEETGNTSRSAWISTPLVMILWSEWVPGT